MNKVKERLTWDASSEDHKDIETPPEMIAFFDEITAVCKKHGLSISHEDGHGAFIIEQFDPFYIEWLQHAIKKYVHPNPQGHAKKKNE